MELKGASLAWAPKDKSSKKNVLEVSGGVGEKEKGLTDGLGPSLSKPQEGGPGELGLEFSGLKTKTASTLGIRPQCFLASQILQLPLQEWSSLESLVLSRGSLGNETVMPRSAVLIPAALA